jgi:hypothetical protein
MDSDVALLVPSLEIYENNRYLVHLFVDRWREMGLRMAVCDDPARVPDAGALFAHFDTTRYEPHWLAAITDHPRCVNGRLRDISKRRVSRQIVARGDGYSGAVVVKTDLNYGGLPELQLSGRRSFWGRQAKRIRRRLPWFLSGVIETGDYKVYDTPDAVPAFVWRNKSFVVERFMPERVDGKYALRQHLCLGGRHVDYLLLSNEPIVKVRNVVEFRPVDETPAELLTMRRELAIDYGRLDYVIRDGHVVLFDVNRTPARSDLMVPYPTFAERLAPGILDFAAAAPTPAPLAAAADRSAPNRPAT